MLLSLLACADPQPVPLRLHLEAEVGGQPVEITDDQPFTNAAGEPFGVRRYKALLTVRSLGSDGGQAHTFDDVWYVDLEDPETLAHELLVAADDRVWTALELVLGVPPELFDHETLAVPPASDMVWPDSLGGGTHYMKFEGRTTTPDGADSTFALHAGPLDGVDYSVPLSLALDPLTLDPEGGDLTLVADLARWMVDPHTITLADLPNGGVMDVAEVQQQLSDNGHDVVTVEAP